MNDLAYAFTLCVATLGPTKAIPVFHMITRATDRRTVLALAAKSTVVATAIVLFVALGASGTLLAWRVTNEAVAIAGGFVLLISAIKSLTEIGFAEPARASAPAGAPTAAASGPAAAPRAAVTAPASGWLAHPVLSPIAVPAIVPPVGVMVVLFFAGTALGNAELQAELVAMLLAIMAMNFVAMVFAAPIVRIVGLPLLQVMGWVFSALQAALGVQAILASVPALHG